LDRFFHRWQLLPLTFVALACAVALATFNIREVAAFQQVSPKLWPYTLALALTLCAIGILIENRSVAAQAEDQAEVEGERAGVTGWHFLMMLTLTAPLMYLFGYFISCVLLLALVVYLEDGTGRWGRLVGVSVLMPLGLYLLFTFVVGQTLPSGVLF